MGYLAKQRHGVENLNSFKTQFDTSVKEKVILFILGYYTLALKQLAKAVAQSLALITVFGQFHLKPTEDNGKNHTQVLSSPL